MNFKSNITTFYVYKALRSFFLVISINILYYLSFGINFTEMMIMGLVIAFANFLFEVPSGAFADLYGRRLSLILSSIFLVGGYTFLAFGNSFLPFAIAMFFMGLSQALFSGSDSALVYDSLIESKEEKTYKQVESNASAIKLAGFALGALVGAFLFTYSIKYPYYVMLFISVLTLFVSFMFKEPVRHKVLRKHWSQLWASLKFAWNHKFVRYLTFYGAIIYGFVLIAHRFYQPYMLDIGVPTKYFGLILAVIFLISAYLIRKTEKIEFFFGERTTLILIPLFIITSFFGMGFYFAFAGLIFLFMFQVSSEMMFPVIKTYVNKHVDSDKRATVLSLSSFGFNTVFLIFSLFFGKIADAQQYFMSYRYLGVTLLVLIIILFAIWFRKKNYLFLTFKKT